MRIWYAKIGQTSQIFHDVVDRNVLIGRAESNDLVLDSKYVSEQAAVLTQQGEQWELTALGEHGVKIGNNVLQPGERVLIGREVPFVIYPFSLMLETSSVGDETEAMRRRELDDQGSQFILKIHRDLVARMNEKNLSDEQRVSEEFVRSLELDVEEIARLHGFSNSTVAARATHFCANTVLGHNLHRLIEGKGAKSQVWRSQGDWVQLFTAVPEMEGLLDDLADAAEKSVGCHSESDLSRQIERIDRGFWQAWTEIVRDVRPELRQYLGLRYLKKQVKDIVYGYGPLEDLLRMPNISEIMVVDSDKIYIEKNGVLERSGRRFVSDDVTLTIIERIVARVGRRIDKSQPLVDARLLDGSRVNAVIPPLAVSGPCLTIRKFPSRRLRVEDLVAKGAFTRSAAEFLRAAVVARCNILVSGGTGTGKTTLLNCLSDFIPDKERIVTIEDTAELQLKKDHVVRLETKVANVEGAGEYTIRDLVRNSLRMRPDRVVVGECRGPEMLDMLQAMNTGHDGSMTTIHANTSEDVILRLEVLVQMAAALPMQSIHRQIASALDLVVQLGRLRDGSRRVTQITEIVNYDEQEQVIRTKDIFLLDMSGDTPVLTPTGALPTFLGELIDEELIDLNAFYR